MHRPWSSVGRQSDAIVASAEAIANSRGAFFFPCLPNATDRKMKRRKDITTRALGVMTFISSFIVSSNLQSFHFLAWNLRFVDKIRTYILIGMYVNDIFCFSYCKLMGHLLSLRLFDFRLLQFNWRAGCRRNKCRCSFWNICMSCGVVYFETLHDATQNMVNRLLYTYIIQQPELRNKESKYICIYYVYY